MPVTVEWDAIDNTVLYYQYIGHWTWFEYEQATKQAGQLVQNLGRPVDVIADFSQSGVLPDGMMSGFRRSMLTAPLDFGVAVIVSKSELLFRLLNAYIRLNRKIGEKLLVASSVVEARALILKRHSQG